MAKKITGCDWSYEVIEGMDAKLEEYFPEAQGQRKSFFAPRSGRDDNNKPVEIKQNFSHLARSAAGHTRELKRDKNLQLYKRAKLEKIARRPKIIVLDLAWNLKNDPLMPKKVSFLTKNCRRINNKRCKSWGELPYDKEVTPIDGVEERDNNELLNRVYENKEWTRKLDHGTACVGALRISNEDAHGVSNDANLKLIWGTGQEPMLWNLSSRADIILLPLREHAPISKKAFKDSFRLVKENAAKLGFDNPDMYRSDEILSLLNTASKQDTFCNQYHLKLKLDKLLDEKFGENGLKIEKISKSIINIYESALTEAGYKETLQVLLDASENAKYIGRGDTLVAPMHIGLCKENKKKDKGSLLDQIFRPKDFIDRPMTIAHGKLLRPHPKHIENIELPIIAYKEVEDQVRKLTCDRQISVIVSAGNSHLDLGQVNYAVLDRALPTRRLESKYKSDEEKNVDVERIAKSLFQTRGCDCGAVLVGSGIVELAEFWIDPFRRRFLEMRTTQKKARAADSHAKKLKLSLMPEDDDYNAEDHRTEFANFGLCIDAYGRGSANDVDYLRRNNVELVIDRKTYAHWKGASIASMVAAACLANVQHIRLLSNFINYMKACKDYERKVAKANANGEKAPRFVSPECVPLLKPYEARAHFQQWRSNECYKYDCLEDLMGAPPDIRDWFKGSCVWNRLTVHAKRGREIIRNKRKLHNVT